MYLPFFLVCGVQDISCIKDLTLLYEAATIEDVYLAYDQLQVDENSLYSCIGVAGSQAGEEIPGKNLSLTCAYKFIWIVCLSYLHLSTFNKIDKQNQNVLDYVVTQDR